MKREAEQELDKLEEEVKKGEVVKDKEGENSDNEDNQQQQAAVEGKRYPPKTRIALITGYNGSDFCGSQKYSMSYS